MTRYMPLLKARQGELFALADLQLATRRGVLPLLDVVPSDAADPESVKDSCRKTVERLAKAWTDPVLLDGGLLDLTLDLGGARGPVFELAEHARAAGLQAIPVLRVSDGVLARTDAAAACATDGRGLGIRLEGDDLYEEDPDDLVESVADVLEQVGVNRGEADLVLDVGVVDGEVDAKRAARVVLPILRGLPALEDYRSVTVAGGAFPKDLSGFAPWSLGRRARFDAVLYDRIVSRKLPRTPDFGDYAVTHPILQTGAAFAPPPQLRYTVEAEWLVLKGSRNDERGHAQFFDICEQVRELPEFAGPALGNADARIADPRSYGKGNGSTWRQVATTHHLDLVVRRLATLGEP